MECSQSQCNNDAMYQYEWLGEKKVCCSDHSRQVIAIGQVMGFVVNMNSIDPTILRMIKLLRVGFETTEEQSLLWFSKWLQENSGPIDMLLWCPNCNFEHIDAGEWSTRLHKTHQCQGCGYKWKPCLSYTRGVSSL